MLIDVETSRRGLLAGFAAVSTTGASAQGHGPPDEQGREPSKAERPSKAEAFAKLPPAEKWRRRFPQPVLVSDLIGRKVLDRNQVVLGIVEAIVAAPEGDLHVAFQRRRLFVLRGDTVLVPNILAALLGPFVILPEASDEDIAGLQAYQPSRYRVVEAGSRIRMALAKH